jgi:hypothetical protein
MLKYALLSAFNFNAFFTIHINFETFTLPTQEKIRFNVIQAIACFNTNQVTHGQK